MRVLLLSRYGSLGASSRLRFLQYLPYLESQGFEFSVCPLLDNDYVAGLYRGRIPVFSVLAGYMSRLVSMLRANRYDLVWAEKEMLPWIPARIELALFPATVPLAVDYDDAVYHRYDRHSLSIVRRLLGRKIDSVMRRAELVVVGNEYLGERARKTGVTRIKMLPTVVDATRYSAKHRAPNGLITIGWIGSPSTAHYLRLIAPVLQKMGGSRSIRVVAIGANPEQLEGLPIEPRPWSEDSEVAEIQKFDIGIMPLPNEPWEQGKCGYKLIQYMACGKPVVASPVGANTAIVREGIEGFLAATEHDWYASLGKLCDSVSLRQRMGAAGRERVEAEYSLQVTAPRLGQMLRSVVEKSCVA